MKLRLLNRTSGTPTRYESSNLFRRRNNYANRHDWSGTNGREHGAAASQRRPSMRGLRHVAESGDGVDGKEGRWLLLAGRPGKEAHQAAGGLVDGSGGGGRQNYRRSPAPS